MGFPDHLSDQDHQAAPNMHVPPERPERAPEYPAYSGDAGYPMAGPARRVNSMSIAALVCGLAQFLLWFLLLVPGFIAAVLGLVFGLVALGQISRHGETGRGMALTGVVLGGLGVVGGIVLAILIAIGGGQFHAHMGY